PIAVSQGGIVGEIPHRPFSIGRADELGEESFGDGIEHAAGASPDWCSASQRNVWGELIAISGTRVWACLGGSGQRALPDSGRARARQCDEGNKANAGKKVVDTQFHCACILVVLVCLRAVISRGPGTSLIDLPTTDNALNCS